MTDLSAILPDSLPYKRLSAFYFWYYGLLGITHPFWAIFLMHRQFSAAEIGLLLAVQMGTRIVSPNLWGALADYTGMRMATIRLGAFFGLLSFSGIYLVEGFWSMMLVIGAYSFFWNAVMPQFEALTLDHLSEQPRDYSRVRMWGSVGFIVAVMLGGYWFEVRVEDFRLAGVIFLGMIFVSTLFVSERPMHHDEVNGASFLQMVKRHPVVAFLVVSFLLQVSHGIYYTFFSLHLENAGYPRSQVGMFWALSVVAEIALFLVMHRLMARWSLWGILLVSLVVTALRWLLIAFFEASVAVMVFAQCLHAFSFGACHAVSIDYLRRFFPGRHRGQGQAIYTSASFGAGGAAGALLGGLVWDYSAQLTFVIAALITLVAVAVAYGGLDYRRQTDPAMRDMLHH